VRCNQTQRDAIVARALEIGAAAAAHEHNLNPNTVRSWVRRSGKAPTVEQRTQRTTAAADAILASTAERKARLAEDLLDDVQRLRSQLFTPTVERKPVVVSDGARNGSHVEIVDVHLDRPAFADQRQIMTSIAIAVDKIQILTGEATERIETLVSGRPIEEQALEYVDELAARRVVA
jgi:transposase-like protein